MPDPTAGAPPGQPAAEAPDDHLLARAAAGDDVAFAVLRDRHLDPVHDHLLRWTRDSALAAAATGAALTALLDRLDTAPDGASARPWLLRSARDHVVDGLQHGDAGDEARVSTAALGAAGASTPGGPAAAAAAWSAVAALDEPHFSTFDLAVRQDLTTGEVAEVLGTTAGEAVSLLAEATDRVAGATPGTEGAVRGAYAALAQLRAPLAVRAAVHSAGDDHFGAPPTRHGPRRTALAAAVVGLVLLLGGVAVALTRSEPPPSGPPSVVAEAVVPSPEPTTTPTLGARAPGEETPTLEPTAAPEPSPTAEPSPSPSAALAPSPEPVSLTVTLLQPSPGLRVVADRTGRDGSATALVPVAAEVRGADDVDVTVSWQSDLAPADVLLRGARGEVPLGLSSPCRDTTHPLRVTATHTSGATATATVEVLVTAACAELTVRIEDPAGSVRVPTDEPGGSTATVRVAAAADGEVAWRWTSDRVPGTVLLDAATGSLQLPATGCDPVTHVVTATAVRNGDGATAAATVEITVEPACDP